LLFTILASFNYTLQFCFKKPYFFLILTLVTWKMQPIFLTLLIYTVTKVKK